MGYDSFIIMDINMNNVTVHLKTIVLSLFFKLFYVFFDINPLHSDNCHNNVQRRVTCQCVVKESNLLMETFFKIF